MCNFLYSRGFDKIISQEILVHRRCDCILTLNEENRLKKIRCLWVCNVCEDEFECLEHLIRHRYNTYHFFPRLDWTSGHLLFTCELCCFTGKEVNELVQHYNEQHVKAVVRKDQVKEEAEDASLENEARLALDAMNIRLIMHYASSSTSMGKILSTNYTSTKYRQYLCEICGKSYTQSSHLWQHLRFHRGVKPFACSVVGCTRKFTIRPDLNDHIRKCHTGVRRVLIIF